jgi:hypothetical protein
MPVLSASGARGGSLQSGYRVVSSASSRICHPRQIHASDAKGHPILDADKMRSLGAVAGFSWIKSHNTAKVFGP